MSKTNIYATICAIIFLFFLLIGTLKNNLYMKNVANATHIVVCSKLIRCYHTRGGWEANISYDYISVKFNTDKKYMNFDKEISAETYSSYCKGKSNLLIVFLKEKPEAFYLLEKASDFEKFNIVPSDTAGIVCDNLIYP